MSGIYIHIPFCKSRCIYCDFYSTTNTEDLQKEYINAVLHEATLRKDYFTDISSEINRHETNNTITGYQNRTKVNELNEHARTLYIGGGTPSTLSLRNLELLIKGIEDALPFLRIDKLKEFTIECNPDDITEKKMNLLYSLGVNRISMGVQTFSDKRLQFLKRRHKCNQIEPAIETILKAGIDNISIDLMFGFPEETLIEWDNDISKALSLGIKHLSAYSLMYEEGTHLHRMLSKGLVHELPEEESVNMYNLLLDRLEAAGYDHYEISNFAKPGYRSIHNSSYWNDEPYIGLGAAAHSYNLKYRHNNICNIKEYIYNINKGTIPCECEIIDEVTHYNDLITTTLRRKEGLLLEYIAEPYRTYLIKMARRGIDNGTLYNDGERIFLTRKGVYVSDDVMSDLIWTD